MIPTRRFTQPLKTYVPVILISLAIGIASFIFTHCDIKLGKISLTLKNLYENYERSILVQRFKYRLKRVPCKDPINPAVAILAVDKETLEKEKLPTSFWFKNFVPVMKMLLENGVKVIGLDYIGDNSINEYLKMILDYQSIERIKKDLEKRLGSELFKKKEMDLWSDSLWEKLSLSHTDKELALLVLSKKVVLPARLNKDGKLLKSNIFLFPIAGWENTGIANLGTFDDEVVFYQRLFYRHYAEEPCFIAGFIGGTGGICRAEPDITKSFVTLLLEKYTGQIMSSDKTGGFRLGSEKIVVDDDQRLWINYHRPLDQQKDSHLLFSYNDVLERARRDDREYFKNNFSGKIVIIGTTALRTDSYRTPVVETKWMPGPEIHGQAISTVLNKDFLAIPGSTVKAAAIIVLCLMAGIITFHFRPGPALLCTTLLIGLYLAATHFLFMQRSIWLETLPVIFMVPVLVAAYLFKYVTEERERQTTRSLFGRYVSKNVMEAIMSNPRNVALGGTMRKVTILFSDINNFTPTSEKLSPEELMRYLNNYFNEMNAIIMNYNGTIKQFVGDEIMVLYGAPIEQEDQALLAVQTALDMVERLNELKAQDPSGKSGFYEVKIGIHTGQVVAGNVGSLDRTEYAAVGDNVNLTSRIEGLNKKLGTTILISEETYQEVQGELENAEFTAFDPQEVKGKEKPIQVYEVKRKR
jgi:class 3 adenylate cyclase